MNVNRLLWIPCLLAVLPLHAAKPECLRLAEEKQLTGAAKASFVRKCERDARDSGTLQCDAAAEAARLVGAARNEQMKRCLSDRQGKD